MCEKLPCVCDICNCGRHRCPHKLRCPGPWDKCTLSEYNTKFVPHDLCPSKSLKPPYTMLLGDGPLSQDTTNRIDYIPQCIVPTKKFVPPDYIKPEGQIDDITMYRKEFGPKELCTIRSVKPTSSRLVPAKFEGETTNRKDFRPWDLPTRHIRKPDSYQPSTDKFDGVASYNRDYIPHCVAPPESCRPKVSILQSTEPMAKDTDYRESYVNHPLDRRAQKVKPCYLQSRVPLDSLTTHKKEFTPKEICVQKSFKPPPHLIQIDKPLSDQTTNRVDYIVHDVERPFRHENGKYIKPEGEMDLNSTYNKDFIGLMPCKSNLVNPPTSKKIQAPFSDVTSYRENFKKWDVAPSKAMAKSIFEPSTDPFEDCTTFKSAYVEHELCPVKSFKPEPHMLSTEPFDDATNYRTEYTKKSQPCCPAAFLNTNPRSVSPDGYMYHCEDQRGHLHYRRGSILTEGNSNKKEILNDNQKLPNVSTEPVV